MASLRVGLGQNNLKVDQFWSDCRHACLETRTIKLAEGGGRLRRRLKVVSGVAAAGNSSVNISGFDHNVGVRKRNMDKENDVSGKVDQWIRDSVQQIVHNIEEAPFLLNIYNEDDQVSRRSNSMKIVREKASVNSWPNIKHRWETGNSIPNGIALVEELRIQDDDHEERLGSVGNDNQHGSSTKVFGIVIQERGVNHPVCYMLKTSRVRSVSGICTHFSIFRVECFGETAGVQFKKQWLL